MDEEKKTADVIVEENEQDNVLEQNQTVREKIIEKTRTIINGGNVTLRGLLTFGIPAFLAIAMLIVGYSLLTNNYKTPLRAYVKSWTFQYKSVKSECIDLTNGLCTSEINDLFKIYKKSDNIQDYLSDMEEYFCEDSLYNRDRYGDNVKYTFEIEDKNELTRSELRKIKDNIKMIVEDVSDLCDEAEDYDSDDWSDVADMLDLKKSEAKEFVDICDDLSEEFKHIDISKGYELEYTLIITGSELEEPLEIDDSLYVFKMNGKWVNDDNIEEAVYMMLYDAIDGRASAITETPAVAVTID